jgi:hypothetical protein
MQLRWLIGFAAAAGLLCLSAAAPPLAGANSTGIIGYSGKQNANKTCNNCHSGGQIPSVSFEGPTQMAPNAVATFRFVVQSNSVNQKAAGFNVAVNEGTLGVVTGQDEQLVAGELTHTKPKANSSGKASWEFTWQAPGTPGLYPIFVSGNSVNRNVSGALGDRSASDVHTVLVVEEATPTETPAPQPATDTPTPLAPTETPTVAPTSTRRNTPLSTATRTTTATATPTPTPEARLARGDANCDSLLGAADLIAVVRQLSTGGVGECLVADANCDGALDTADVDEVVRLLNEAAPAAACLQSP